MRSYADKIENSLKILQIGEKEEPHFEIIATCIDNAEVRVSKSTISVPVRIDGYRNKNDASPRNGMIFLNCGENPSLDTLAELKAKLRKDTKIILRYSRKDAGGLKLNSAVVDDWVLDVA